MIKFISFSTKINYEILIYFVDKDAGIPVWEWYAKDNVVINKNPESSLPCPTLSDTNRLPDWISVFS